MCKKSCLLWVFEDEIISRKDIHNHPPDDAEIEVEKIVHSLKEEVRATARPVPAVYNEQIQAVACRSDRDEIAAKLPTFTSVKSSLYRHRRSLLPPLPKTRADVHFEGKNLMIVVANCTSEFCLLEVAGRRDLLCR